MSSVCDEVEKEDLNTFSLDNDSGADAERLDGKTNLVTIPV